MATSLVKEYLTGTTVLARVCSTSNFYVIYHMFIYIWRLAIICSILQCLCYISDLYLDLKIPNQEHNIYFLLCDKSQPSSHVQSDKRW